MITPARSKYRRNTHQHSTSALSNLTLRAISINTLLSNQRRAVRAGEGELRSTGSARAAMVSLLRAIMIAFHRFVLSRLHCARE